MNKFIKIIKFLVVGIYLTAFVVLILFQIWSILMSLDISVSPQIYWFSLVGWVFLIRNFKLRSSFSFKIGFVFFVLAAVFATFGFRIIAETIMRVSFIGFLIAIAQSLIEYKKSV